MDPLIQIFQVASIVVLAAAWLYHAYAIWKLEQTVFLGRGLETSCVIEVEANGDSVLVLTSNGPLSREHCDSLSAYVKAKTGLDAMILSHGVQVDRLITTNLAPDYDYVHPIDDNQRH